MKSPLHLCFISMLLLCSGMVSGQNTVKLFNGTNNKERFVEAYNYDAVIYKSNSFNDHLFLNTLQSWYFMGEADPFRMHRTTPLKSILFTNNLGEYLLYQDSVQVTTAVKDSLSPILILQFLKEELETRGIATQYPVKDKQPTNYTIEISACECRYHVNSFPIHKSKRRVKYTGNYQVEYVLTWKERKDSKAAPVENEMTDRIVREWKNCNKTEMKRLPNLTFSMTELCWRIAQTKAEQIASLLKEE